MKKIILGLIIGLAVAITSNTIAYVRHAGNATVYVSCVEGYKFVIVENQQKVAITQFMRDGGAWKSHPSQPIRCK